MFFNERFIGTNNAAPITLASPAIIHRPNISVFKKDQNERLFINKFKKEHNKKFKQIFGTKRPSAGKVNKHFTKVSAMQTIMEGIED